MSDIQLGPEVFDRMAENLNGQYEKVRNEAAAMLAGGVASAAGLGYSVAELHIDKPVFQELAISGQTVLAYGFLLLGGIRALKARELKGYRDNSSAAANARRAGEA